MGAKEYNDKLMNLPEFLKDFHDQKDVFKCIQEWYESSPTIDRNLPNSWVDNHVYTIDLFLFFMGLHGYKLQKSKSKNVEFYDINATISQFKKRKADEFNNILNDRKNDAQTIHRK